jgi:hypothetical protein
MGIVTNLQKEDQYLNPFIVYLTDDKLPESQKEARRLYLPYRHRTDLNYYYRQRAQ